MSAVVMLLLTSVTAKNQAWCGSLLYFCRNEAAYGRTWLSSFRFWSLLYFSTSSSLSGQGPPCMTARKLAIVVFCRFYWYNDSMHVNTAHHLWTSNKSSSLCTIIYCDFVSPFWQTSQQSPSPAGAVCKAQGRWLHRHTVEPRAQRAWNQPE